jgi:hypothetical protein
LIGYFNGSMIRPYGFILALQSGDYNRLEPDLSLVCHPRLDLRLKRFVGFHPAFRVGKSVFFIAAST